MMGEVSIVEADNVEGTNNSVESSRFMQEFMGNYKLNSV